MAAAGAADAQTRDRASRIDRIDRLSRVDRADRLSEAEHRAQQAIERRERQALIEQQTPPTPDNPLLSDPRLMRARDGSAARRGEILALNLSPAARAAALAAGMTVIAETSSGPAGAFTFTRLAAPAPLDPGVMIDMLRAADPQGVFDFNHAFVASGPAPAPQLASPPAQAAGGPSLVVGMIDGGVLADHPNLANAKMRQRAFPETSSLSPTDHGTSVAGRLAESIKAPFSLLVADVLAETGAEWTGADAVAAALAWLSAEPVGVINVSLAGPHNVVVERMAAHVRSGGRTIVAAVGNGGPFSALIYPAAYPGVVGVTAVDREGRVWPLASTGPHVDRSALGVDIEVATLGGHTISSGTSWAAPVIAAEIASARAAAAPVLVAAD